MEMISCWCRVIRETEEIASKSSGSLQFSLDTEDLRDGEDKQKYTRTRLGRSDLLGPESLADTQNSDELISTRNVDEEENP